MAPPPRWLVVGGGAITVGSVVAGTDWLSGPRTAEIAAVALVSMAGVGLMGAGLASMLGTDRRSVPSESTDLGGDSIVRSVMALFIVFASMGSIVVLAFARGPASAESFAALVSGIMGGVVGYYFGSRGVDQFQRRASEESTRRSELEAAATLVDHAKGNAILGLTELTRNAASAIRFREKVVDAAPSDPGLKEKLKAILDDSVIEE